MTCPGLTRPTSLVPVPLTVLRSNSIFDKTLHCSDLKIGLTNHSAILHTSREYCCRDMCTIRALHIFIEFRIPSKYLSLVARAHGLPWNCMVWYMHVYSCYAYIWHALPPNRLKCLLVSPDDQWKWHCVYEKCQSLPSVRINANYLCRFGVDEWYEIRIYFVSWPISRKQRVHDFIQFTMSSVIQFTLLHITLYFVNSDLCI